MFQKKTTAQVKKIKVAKDTELQAGFIFHSTSHVPHTLYLQCLIENRF